jgi:transposase-like protein
MGGPRNIEDTIDAAVLGAALLSGGRRNYSELARSVGVGRSQPSRWRSGATVPRKKIMKRIRVLARLCHAIEVAKSRARAQLDDLS